MEIDFSVILRFIAIGLLHWILVFKALRSLIERKNVLGGKKTPWALAIIFITCIGPILFLLLNPVAADQIETKTEVQQEN